MSEISLILIGSLMKQKKELIKKVKVEWERMLPHLDERGRRLLAANIAMRLGHGGMAIVKEVTGLSYPTIKSGKAELKSKKALPDKKRVRRGGAGRPHKTKEYPKLKEEVQALIEPHTLGDPENKLLHSSKSLRKLEAALLEKGIEVSYGTIAKILRQLDYSLQANKKTLSGKTNADRDAQFEYIENQIKEFSQAGEPSMSIDTKKKELVGDYKNAGREYGPKGKPIEVKVYDFPLGIPKATPYGVYFIANNIGWVNVGVSSDTAAFAVESIRKAWTGFGKQYYPNASKLLIVCDGGGSNGSRVRLFKRELQSFANETGLSITVCHYPPGTSKWNKIEHKLFAFVSINWRGKPLKDLATIVNLISSTKTNAGLKVFCDLDEHVYEKGIKITDKEMKVIDIKRHEWHGEWNYTISPNKI